MVKSVKVSLGTEASRPTEMFHSGLSSAANASVNPSTAHYVVGAKKLTVSEEAYIAQSIYVPLRRSMK
jgi:hypothetical protein